MVEEESACLDVESEQRLPIAENHSMIAKLSSKPGSAYYALSKKIQAHAKDAPRVCHGRWLRTNCVALLKTSFAAIVSIVGDHDALPGRNSHLVDNAVRTLNWALVKMGGFRKLLEDIPLFAALLMRESTYHCAASIFRAIEALHACLTIYGSFEQEASVMTPPVSFDLVRSSSRVYSEERLDRTALRIRDCVLKMGHSLSLAMLQLTHLIAVPNIGEGATGRQSGLETVLFRQDLFRRLLREELKDSQPLAGRLEKMLNAPLPLRIMMYHSSLQSEGQPVFVEYRPMPRHFDPIQAKQIKQLASLLQQNKHSTERPFLGSFTTDEPRDTLECLGYVEDRANWRFKLLYSIPEMPAPFVLADLCSLKGVIGKEVSAGGRNASLNKIVPLEERFHLAHSLCLSVLLIHTYGWVHKNICSANVICIPADRIDKLRRPHLPGEAEDAEDASHIAVRYQPCLVGFESARHVRDESDLTPSDEAEANLYRHPQRQGAPKEDFSKLHDFYALGVVLYEVGVFRTVKTVFKQLFDHLEKVGEFPHPKEVASKILKRATTDLPSRMGTKYTDAVLRCLTGEFGVQGDGEEEDAETRLSLAFQEQVIEPIGDGRSL